MLSPVTWSPALTEGSAQCFARLSCFQGHGQAEQAASASAVLGSLAQLPQRGCQKGAQGTCM